MSTSFPRPPRGMVNPGSVVFLLSGCLPTPEETLYAAGPGDSIPKNTLACSLPMNTFSAWSRVLVPKPNDPSVTALLCVCLPTALGKG